MAAQHSSKGELLTDEHKCFLANIPYKSALESHAAA